MKYGASEKKKMMRERENIEQSIETLEKEITTIFLDDSQKQQNMVGTWNKQTRAGAIDWIPNKRSDSHI